MQPVFFLIQEFCDCSKIFIKLVSVFCLFNIPRKSTATVCTCVLNCSQGPPMSSIFKSISESFTHFRILQFGHTIALWHFHPSCFHLRFDIHLQLVTYTFVVCTTFCPTHHPHSTNISEISLSSESPGSPTERSLTPTKESVICNSHQALYFTYSSEFYQPDITPPGI